MLDAYRTSSASVAWKPSPVVSLATNPDNARVAAAREDGSLEVWLVSPGSVGWHCQLTIHGDPNSRISSLVWLRSGRLLSSSIDGSVSEWDLSNLKRKIVIESIGASIWQMAVSPSSSVLSDQEDKPKHAANGYREEGSDIENDDGDKSEDDSDSDSIELHEHSVKDNERLAIACDDGCVRVYTVLDSLELVYTRSLPRVSGRVLSVAWSPDTSLMYSGTSDGFIRCWDAKTFYEIYRITVGLGGLGSGSELCVWSLLALRSGALVSADSTGSVQFWDSQHGTLLQVHSRHKGDVNALAAAPNHNGVFSAGSDGKVILYKLSSEKVESADDKSTKLIKKWVYVDHVRAHTHDVRALTIAVPISREDPLPDEKFKRVRRKEKPIDFSYKKWAHMGVPMLISAGDDTKLFAYSVQEFTKFAPHDISPAPQRLPIHLVYNSVFNKNSLLLVQAPYWLDILSVRTKSGAFSGKASGSSGGVAATELLARVKAKASRKIICSAISASGALIAYSDHSKPSLFELDKLEGGKGAWSVKKKQLPQKLPSAHCMVFTSDSARLILAGHDKKIYVVDVGTSEVLHTFKPSRKESEDGLPPDEPPITRLFTSSDGQWLATVNCFGDVYVYNLEIQRQHWFISRLDGASVTAGGFSPSNNNVLVLTTSSNQVYVFDVEAKQLGEWSTRNTFKLPRRFQEFPGEVIGLSFPPPSSSSDVIIYSSRSMCVIDFGLPVDREENGGGGDLKQQDMDLALTKLRQNGKKLKHNLKAACELEAKLSSRKNFEFFAFRDPVLFVGHLSKGSVLIVDRPWMDVVKTMEAAPVHRHIFGT